MYLSKKRAKGRMIRAPERLRYVRRAKTNMPSLITSLERSIMPVVKI
jgi:hypothetical protein